MEVWGMILFGVLVLGLLAYWALESRGWIVIANAACNSRIGLGPVCSRLRAAGVRYRTRTSGGGATFSGPSFDVNTSVLVRSSDRARARAAIEGTAPRGV